MKVKIGNNIYSGDDEPIMVILTKVDKDHIASMPDNLTKYAEFPDHIPEKEIEEFMKID